MATPEAKKKPLARCGERVVEARVIEAASTFIFGNTQPLQAGKGIIETMYLHPAGLLVIPSDKSHKGKRIIIPGARVEYVVVAEEEP